MAKIISVSADDITYHTLPGSQGELAREGSSVDDTIFGQDYRSGETAILGWSLSANAVYKGYVGYKATIKKSGTPTALTDEAMSLVSGKTYQVTAASKRMFDRSTAIVFEDGGTPVDAEDIESVDYLFGRVTFASGYTVSGAVTVASGNYIPLSDIGCAMSYTLTQTGEAIDDTCFATAQSNGGYRTHSPGLKTVGLELQGVYEAAADFETVLSDRDELLIEINPDGQGYSVARGFFKLLTMRQSGNVGALEEANLNFTLNVPYMSSPNLAYPFAWVHDALSPIPMGIKVALDGWQNNTKPYVKYLADGTVGFKGSGVITSMTLSGGLETMNVFQVAVQGDGGLTAA